MCVPLYTCHLHTTHTHATHISNTHIFLHMCHHVCAHTHTPHTYKLWSPILFCFAFSVQCQENADIFTGGSCYIFTGQTIWKGGSGKHKGSTAKTPYHTPKVDSKEAHFGGALEVASADLADGLAVGNSL